MKTLLIDASSTVLKKKSYLSGIGQSTMWLLNKLSKRTDLPFKIEVYAATGLKYLDFDFYDWPFKHYIIPFPARFVRPNERYSWATLCRKYLYKYDLFHIPGVFDDTYKDEPFVSTFHDLIWYKNAPEGSRRKRLYEQTAKNAKGILCISEFVKQDVINTLNVDPDKVSVVYWAANRDLYHRVSKQEIENVKRQYNIHHPYFFTCSCSNPRKNVSTALAAFRKFLTYNPEHVFVLAWGNPPQALLNEYSTEIQSGKIIFLPFVSDEDLVALYNGASLSVYVSREEGFGSPIHESFGCGTPVMTCKNSSLYEVGKDAAIYVGEDNIDEMVDVFLCFERDKYDYESFLLKSESVLSLFHEDKCVQGYIDFYSKYL